MNDLLNPSDTSCGSAAALQPADHQAEAITLPAPSHDAIALRAYEIYEHSGYQEGRCVENWLQAEGELRASLLAASLTRAEADVGHVELEPAAADSPILLPSKPGKDSVQRGRIPVPAGRQRAGT